MPKISVIVLTYNSAAYIARCLRSLERQTCADFEAIVVDAGSQDETEAIVRQFDQRFRWTVLAGSDMGSARNHGIRISRGEFVTFLDSDDFYLAGKLSIQIDELKRRPDVDVTFCDAWVFRTGKPLLFGRKRRVQEGVYDLADFLCGTNYNLNTMFCRRAAFRENIWFAEGESGRYGEEWKLQLAMAAASVPISFIPSPLVVVEIRPDSNTLWSRQPMMKEQAVIEFERTVETIERTRLAHLDIAPIRDSYFAKLAVSRILVADGARADQAAQRVRKPSTRCWLRLGIGFVRWLPGWLVGPGIRLFWLWRQNRSFAWMVCPPEVAREIRALVVA
jgi:GT2 family glycosyltransferase